MRTTYKQYILLLLFVFVHIGLYSQTANQNYILSRTMTNDAGTLYLDNIQYFDGLGRPIQTVQKGVTPLKADLVTYQEYDAFGREERSWMPSVATSNNGAFMPLATVKTKALTSYGDSVAYSKPVYEASPLNRPLEQYGPGVAWKTASASAKTRYLTNVATGDVKLICSLFSVEGTGLATKVKRSGNYAAGQLYVTELKDEQGNLSYEFKDKLGQVILTRQIENNVNHDTYYVYDDFGNKCFVLPPPTADNLSLYVGSWDNTNATSVAQYAYIYRYDKRNRCVWKKLPGCEPITCVYDKADRLIFSQDGEQWNKTPKEWTFSIPDALGRIVLTGTCTKMKIGTATTETDITVGSLDNIVVNANWGKVTNTFMGYTISGVAPSTFTVLTANYYNHYEYQGYNSVPVTNPVNIAYNVQTGYGTQHTSAKGLLTGSMTALLDGSGKFLYSAVYYDYRGNVIQSKSTNHLGGMETEYIAYNFTGQPVQKLHLHTATGKTTQTELYTYVYDHAGRLTTTKHKLNTGAEVILAQNTYDELGRLNISTANNQTNLKVTYGYNVRSWTKTINNPLFSQTLYYEDSYGGSAKQYNGNISAMAWMLQNDVTPLGYTFTYDNLSRLTKAIYLRNGSVVSNGYETSYTYDKMGNMKTLTRSGLKATSSWGLVDNLTMTYAGNQLIKVEDAIPTISVAGSMDFKNYSNVATEYLYNRNGAMTKDLNKGISDIQYNSLNLPRLMDIKSPVAEGRNEYTYTATGAKLKVVKKWNPNYSTTPVMGSSVNTTLMTVSESTDYVGNVIYENGALKRILTDNGYIEGNIYYFYVKDHLGNNRVTAKSDGSLVQATHFYPFGSSFAVAIGSNIQPYKYGGKELDVMHGLNQYDYSARQKDDWRFTTMDPLTEKKPWLSPYVYCSNNPINRIDPDGRDDYRLDRDGNMHFVKQTDASNHTIYATNAKGNIDTKSSINVGKYVIGGKETIEGIQGRRSDGSIESSTIDVYSSAGDKESTALFEFASKNTDVEWSQLKTTQNGTEVNYIATSHSGNTDVAQGYIINRIFSQNDKMSNQNSMMGLSGTNIREANHSHPNGSTIVSGGDANLAKTLQSRFPNANMHNYTPNNGKYTFFDQYSMPGLLPEIEVLSPLKKK